MGHIARGRRLTPGQTLARQALGLGMAMLVISTAYAGARIQIGDASEQDVENVAEESSSQQDLRVEINTHIVEVATRYGIEPKLVAAIVDVESQFNVHARSRRGAEGLMQLMPATAADLDVQDSFDPRDNIDGGVRHLKRLLIRFHHNLPLALAAYNAGEQAVINHRGIPPYRETRQYVIRVLRRYDRDAARAVAQQLAQPRPGASVTKTTHMSVAAGSTGGMAAVSLTPAPADAEPLPLEPAPRERKRSESP
jgi:Transglycosylase SLT domain